MHEQEVGIEFLKALNRYFTPVAVGVMLFGLILNPDLPKTSFLGCIGIIIAALTFNVITAVHVIENPASWRKVGYLRVGVNLFLNACAYLLLYSHWPIIWVLFSLGPVAMAFYGDVTETFFVMGVSASIMAGCLFYDGIKDPRLWGATVVQIMFMLLLSLFLIRVAALIRREHSPAEGKA
ncbi:MAG: hypothetical protein HY925_05130 [Elusimicrobia bacterium]|nr:hypothetical protein [Elusimicrobiota bacterium]